MTFADKYKDEHGFIVDPNGSDPKNPGDACWQTCWLYFVYCVAGYIGGAFWSFIVKEYDSDPIGAVEKFLRSYYEKCCLASSMITHPLRQDHFSRDQLSPLLLLISAVYKFQPHLRGLAEKILRHIVFLDEKNSGSLHDDKNSKDDLNNANRFIISNLCALYGIPCKSYGEAWFSAVLKMYEAMWATNFLFPEKIIPRAYTIWNNLGLLTAIVIHDGKFKKLRDNFSWFGDHGWGPAYRLVAGKPVSEAEIVAYKGKTAQHIDIVHQRGLLPTQGYRPTLDYPITLAIREVWK